LAGSGSHGAVVTAPQAVVVVGGGRVGGSRDLVGELLYVLLYHNFLK